MYIIVYMYMNLGILKMFAWKRGKINLCNQIHSLGASTEKLFVMKECVRSTTS